MTEQSKVHHVVGLVRPENFQNAISRMSQSLRTPFYGPFDRLDAGVRVAISMDAGIELITPLSADAEAPLQRLLSEKGEHWMSIVVAVRDLEDICARLAELGYEPSSCFENIPGSLPPGGPPIADRFSRLDEVCYAPEAFAGLNVVVAAIVENIS